MRILFFLGAFSFARSNPLGVKVEKKSRSFPVREEKCEWTVQHANIGREYCQDQFQ